MTVKIVWDERKRAANLDKHGMDFVALTEDFFLAALIRPARADRFKAVGKLGQTSVAVIFRRLGREGVSIISMRTPSVKERRPAND